MTDDIPSSLRWASVVSLGAVAGWIIISLWSPYSDYAVLAVPSVVAAVVFVLCGLTIAWLLREPRIIAAGVGVFGLTTVLFPVAATVITAHLLDRGHVLAVMLYQAAIRLLLIFAPVCLLVIGGAAVAFVFRRG